MSTRKLKLVIFLCEMSLLIASCGPGQILGPAFTPAPTSTFTPTPIPPTATPTSTPTTTPTSTKTPAPIPPTATPPILPDPLTVIGENKVQVDASSRWTWTAHFRNSSGWTVSLYLMKNRVFCPDGSIWATANWEKGISQNIVIGPYQTGIGSSWVKGEKFVGCTVRATFYGKYVDLDKKFTINANSYLPRK